MWIVPSSLHFHRKSLHQFVTIKGHFLLFVFRNRNHTYFRVSDHSNDYEDTTTYPLQPTINTQTNFNILEAQIQEGDTLQAIALRFNCTVSLLGNDFC